MQRDYRGTRNRRWWNDLLDFVEYGKAVPEMPMRIEQ